MPFSFANPRTCEFVSVIDVPISTFTGTAFPGGLNWNFDNHSLYPLANAGYWDTGALAWVGCGGNIFDIVTGLTNFKIGDVTTFAANGNWLGAEWDFATQKLCFPVTFAISNSGPNQAVNVVNISCPIGAPVVQPFTKVLLFTVTNAINSLFPTSASMAFSPAIIGSIRGRTLYWIETNSPRTEFWNNLNADSTLFSPSLIGWSAGVSNAGSIPYNNTNWIANQGTLLNNTLIETQWGSTGFGYNMNYVSPDGVFNMNAILNSNVNIGAFQTSTFGFIFLAGGNTTFFGRTFNGYGILIRPDGLKYWLLNIIPTDAGSVNWRASAPTGKIDGRGNMWIKALNTQTELYPSITALNLQPQIHLSPPALPIIGIPHNPGLFK